MSYVFDIVNSMMDSVRWKMFNNISYILLFIVSKIFLNGSLNMFFN